MNERDEGYKIAQRIKDETDEVVASRDLVWNKVSGTLFPDSQPQKAPKWKGKWLVICSMLVVGLLIWSSVSTEKGQALLKTLQEMFVKEKVVELQIEGEKEDIETEVQINEQLEYVIYIDNARYTLTKGETADTITTKTPLADRYPEVSMEIKRVEDTSQEEIIEEIKTTITREEMEITLEDTVDRGLPMKRIAAIGKGKQNTSGNVGEDWDSPIYRYYVTEEINQQYYLITEKYFLEAAEGHGARFESMLNTFEITN